MTNPPEPGPPMTATLTAGWQSLPGFREEPQGPATGHIPDAELAEIAAAMEAERNEAEAGL